MTFYVAHGDFSFPRHTLRDIPLFKWEFMIPLFICKKIGLLDRSWRKSYLVIQEM